MLSRKNIIRLAVTFSIFCWLALVFSDLTILFSNTNDIDPGILPEFPDLFLALYVLGLFVFFKFKIEKAESVNFIDLLWRVFVTGLLTTIGSLGLRSFGLLIGNTRLASNYLVSELIFLINIGLVTAFIVSTLIVWKRLILIKNQSSC